MNYSFHPVSKPCLVWVKRKKYAEVLSLKGFPKSIPIILKKFTSNKPVIPSNDQHSDNKVDEYARPKILVNVMPRKFAYQLAAGA